MRYDHAHTSVAVLLGSLLLVSQGLAADPLDEPTAGELLVQLTPTASAAVRGRSASVPVDRTGLAPVDAALDDLDTFAVVPLLDKVAAPGLRVPNRAGALAAHGLDRTYLLRYRGAKAPDEAARRFAGLSDVVYAEPNHRTSIAKIPNDPLFSAQWPHDNTGQATRYGGGTVGVPDGDLDTMEAWDVETGSPNVIVAIIDTGIDRGHPEFAGRLLPGYDIANNDADPSDDNFHGTACAGVAAAAGDNGLGVAGTAWNVRLLPVKTFDFNGSGTTDDAAIGIAWAASQGARILSLSFRVSPSQTLANALNYALSQGSSIFAAAGNWRIFPGGGDPSVVVYPASHPGVIAVGALSPCNERKSLTSCDGENYWASHYGSALAFLAPGVRIHTTDIRGALGYDHSSDYLTEYNGTSAATPYAAGVAALVLSYNPTLSNHAVRATLERAADDLGPPGWDPEHGWGRLNAHRALLNSCECDDHDDLTTDICDRGGACRHELLVERLVPALSLLLDAACGDGLLDADEACDDGNDRAGDCCSPTCHFEAAGTVCGGGGCDPRRCDGAGSCL
jgi:cysteine-rich repeat protein